jgi:hypothetical protein
VVRAKRAHVPALLWLWAGPAIVFGQLALRAWDESLYARWMDGELGLIENLTVAFLVAALVLCLQCYRERRRVGWRFFGPTALAAAAGLSFFAGEETSWGQHWFGFDPPRGIASRNDQGELNLHNDPLLGPLFDQLPRFGLTVGVLVGGIVGPFVRRARGLSGRDFASPGPSGWMWPPFECLPAALLTSTVTLPAKVYEALDRTLPPLLDFGPGETKECCLALFLLVYVYSLRSALVAAPDPTLARPLPLAEA